MPNALPLYIAGMAKNACLHMTKASIATSVTALAVLFLWESITSGNSKGNLKNHPTVLKSPDQICLFKKMQIIIW